MSIVADAKGSIREIILPKGLDLDRPKRTRTSFTAEQLYRLEMEFQRCQYVVGRERTELARQLNLSETQVCMHCKCTFVHPLHIYGFITCKLKKHMCKGKGCLCSNHVNYSVNFISFPFCAYLFTLSTTIYFNLKLRLWNIRTTCTFLFYLWHFYFITFLSPDINT